MAMGANQGIEAFNFTVAVPEPTSLAFVGIAAAGMLGRRYRRKA